MIKNQYELINTLQPIDAAKFLKWLSNKIESVLKLKDLPNLLPYSVDSKYGNLEISETEIKINNLKIIYDF